VCGALWGETGFEWGGSLGGEVLARWGPRRQARSGVPRERSGGYVGSQTKLSKQKVNWEVSQRSDSLRCSVASRCLRYAGGKVRVRGIL